MYNIVLFGGTFDPIHNGHIFMINECISKLKPNKFIVIPTCIPPHKQQNNNITSAIHRLNMCKLALQDIEEVDISDYEISKSGISYTYDTVKYFKKVYSNAKIYLLIGSDMLFTFKTWNKCNEILELSSLIVMTRNNASLFKLKNYIKDFDNSNYEHIKFIDSHIPSISSTDIRQRLINNCEVDELVPYRVKYYIEKYNLYK